MNEEKRIQALIALAELFDRPPLSEAVLAMYDKALDRFTDEQFDRAMNMAVKTCKFFPKPAELIEFMQGDAAGNALVAWETLQQTMQQHGPYRSVLFQDGRIFRVVQALGGWKEVCSWLTKDLPYRRAEFMKLYASAPVCRSEVLAGEFELENRARGYLNHIPQPVLIGNGQLGIEHKPGDSK